MHVTLRIVVYYCHAPVDAPDMPLSIIFDILKALAFQKYST